jgi:hypothetical protein
VQLPQPAPPPPFHPLQVRHALQAQVGAGVAPDRAAARGRGRALQRQHLCCGHARGAQVPARARVPVQGQVGPGLCSCWRGAHRWLASPFRAGRGELGLQPLASADRAQVKLPAPLQSTHRQCARPQARPDRLAAHILPHTAVLQRQPLHGLQVRAAAHPHTCHTSSPAPAAHSARHPASSSADRPATCHPCCSCPHAGAACALTAASPTSSRRRPPATPSGCAASPPSSSRALVASTSRRVGAAGAGAGAGGLGSEHGLLCTSCAGRATNAYVGWPSSPPSCQAAELPAMQHADPHFLLPAAAQTCLRSGPTTLVACCPGPLSPPTRTCCCSWRTRAGRTRAPGRCRCVWGCARRAEQGRLQRLRHVCSACWGACTKAPVCWCARSCRCRCAAAAGRPCLPPC